MPAKQPVFFAHDFSGGQRLKNYRRTIEEAFKGFPFKPFYGTKLSLIKDAGVAPEERDRYFDHIIKGIRKSKFVIADITSYKNPRAKSLNFNVILELGFAYGARKTAVILCHEDAFMEAQEKLSNLAGRYMPRYKNMKGLKMVIQEHLEGFKHAG